MDPIYTYSVVIWTDLLQFLYVYGNSKINLWEQSDQWPSKSERKEVKGTMIHHTVDIFVFWDLYSYLAVYLIIRVPIADNIILIGDLLIVNTNCYVNERNLESVGSPNVII